MAGESARAEAHTKRVKAEQVLPHAGASERGAEDEESTARVLGALSADGWRIFHDVRWPGRAQASIDHIVVGPGGVFVVDSETWSGDIEVKSGALRQDGKRRARHVIASAAAAMAVGELLPGLTPEKIRPVICFARREPIYGWSGDTMICSTENIATFLTSSPRALDEAEMTEIAETLALSLQTADARLPPPASTYAGDATPLAPSRESPRRAKRLPRPPMPRPVRIVAVIGALAVAAVVAFQLDLPARIGQLGADAAHRVVVPTKRFGTTASVAGLSKRPSLEITAGTPAVTRSKLPGVTVTPGNELVAVPVSVRNSGDTDWAARSDVHAELTDSSGATYSSDPAYTSVGTGTALPAKVTLSPGEQTSGLIVFEVPRGVQVAKLRLGVGPGLPAILRWSVH